MCKNICIYIYYRMCTFPYLTLSYIILRYVTIPYIALDYLTLLHYLALLCIALHNIHGGRSKYVSQNCAKLLFRWGARYIVYITWSWHSARTKLPRKAPVDWSPVDEIANEVPLQAHDVAANDGTWPENTSPTRRCIPQWLLQISQNPCFLWWKSTWCWNMLKRRIWSIGWWNVVKIGVKIPMLLPWSPNTASIVLLEVGHRMDAALLRPSDLQWCPCYGQIMIQLLPII